MNPAFARTLKELEQRLDGRLAETRTILEGAVEDFKAIRDFIEVEKIKTRSNVQRSLEDEDFGNKTSMQNMVWLQHLQRFTNDFTEEGLLASVTFLDRMIERLETMFIDDEDKPQTIDEVAELTKPPIPPIVNAQ